MRIYLSLLVFVRWTITMVTTQAYLEPEVDPCAKCEHKYTYRGSRKGIFTSPKFPENYPERTTCCYFFHANDNGRVKIEFDYFDLEKSDRECRYDFIEISSINAHGYKEQPKSLFCGTSTPPIYISTHSKLEIIFHSDVTNIAKGFLGHYEFLDTNWHPFPASTIGCGPGYLTGHGGVLQSPQYPAPYPALSGCTWVIKVEEQQRVLITFISLDITQYAKCQHGSNTLMIFDGFFTPDKNPTKYCWQLKHESKERKQYISKSDRVVLRFESSLVNTGNMKGFQLSWTAITMSKTGTCGQFECAREGTSTCDRTTDQELCKSHHFCIHTSLKCNEVPNCGAQDTSDERKCLNEIIRYVAYIGGPVLAFIIILATVLCCYKRHCSNQTVKYSVPKEQGNSTSPSFVSTQTQSSNMPLRSLDHSPRSSCVMYTTSFTDCAIGENHHAGTPDKPAPNGHINNSNSLTLPSNSTTKVDPSDQESGQSYKGHKKRSSYQMMQELCYEDGNIVIADI